MLFFFFFGFEPLMRKKYIELKNTVLCVPGLGAGDTHDRPSKQAIHTWLQNEKLVPGSIRFWFPHHSAACGGSRLPWSRLWALQGSFQHTHLQQHMVHFPQKFLIMLLPFSRPFWQLLVVWRHRWKLRGAGESHPCTGALRRGEELHAAPSQFLICLNFIGI